MGRISSPDYESGHVFHEQGENATNDAQQQKYPDVNDFNGLQRFNGDVFDGDSKEPVGNSPCHFGSGNPNDQEQKEKSGCHK